MSPRAITWSSAIVLMAVLPLVFGSGFSLSLLCQGGILIVFALSYNLLLGQTGLLSFGHAVYYGLGAFFTIHALNLAKGGAFPLPVALMPLVGGAAGLGFGLLLGYITTRRAGTTFAMISLGVGELVAAGSLMFPAFFGGEAGVSGNRVVGEPLLGVNFGSQREMYYLVAAWTLASVAAMFALTHTPLGRMANAVRDNPERAQFVGYDPQWVRFLMVALGGLFAGIAGGLAALNYEIVTSESLNAHTSGLVLLATFLGGLGFFAGPIIGAIVLTLMQTLLAGITQAWPFYFGLVFLSTVLFAPGGIASLASLQWTLWRSNLLARVAPVYARMAVPLGLALVAAVLVIELGYRASAGAGSFTVAGLSLPARSVPSWLAVLAFFAFACAATRWQWRRESPRWDAITAKLGKSTRE